MGNPQAPSGVAAVAGNQEVSVNWKLSPGASGYHVKRSTSSGGPYAQIAALSGNNYKDSSVIIGTTYYYVVSAFNSAGESPDSNEVTATP